MSVVVVATVSPAPGYLDDVVAAYAGAAAEVHAEEGCELYALHEGEDRLVVVEKWSGLEALRRHGASPTMLAVRESVADKVRAPTDVQVLQPHLAGVSAKGGL